MAFWQYFVVVAIFFQLCIVPKPAYSQQKCLGGFDIYFVLDKSGSVSPRHFQGQTVDFVRRTVGNFAGTGVRVSFITFSETKVTETVLRLTGDRLKIQEGLIALRKVIPGGGTTLGPALGMANNQIKDLGGSQASIIIILTDGRIDDIGSATDQTKRAREAGAAVYVIGVAAYVRNDLERLANKPSEHFVFTEPNYELLKNLTDDIANKSCVELTSVDPKQACLGENSTVTLYGRGFIKYNVAVWCGFRLNETYRLATKAIAIEDRRLVCPVPALKDTKSSFMLQVSMNNGTTFVSSNVNITARNCTKPVKPVKPVEPEKPVKPEKEKQDEIAETEKKTNVGLIVALLFLLAFLILLALWWFWPRISKTPPRKYQPATVPEPAKKPPPRPPPPPPPAPPVEKTAGGRVKWPTVDASFYGGGGVGGIAPVRVHWGEKGSTEAGARLAKAKPLLIDDTDEVEDVTVSSKRSRSRTPGCWTVAKIKVMAGVEAMSSGYRRVASHRPQPGANWLYSSDPA